MSKNIKGLTLITGTTSGVGLNTLKPLLRFGWEIIAINRSNKRAIKTAAEYLTREEIKRCEKDENSSLTLIKSSIIEDLPPRKKDTKYTPLSLRQEKPFAILWLIKRYPNELTSSQIAKLTGSTKNTVDAIRNGTYREAVLETKSPMDIGLCTYEQLEKSLNRSRKSKPQEDK